jgi:hypothetical protein
LGTKRPLDEKTKRQQFALKMHDASLKTTASAGFGIISSEAGCG